MEKHLAKPKMKLFYFFPIVVGVDYFLKLLE